MSVEELAKELKLKYVAAHYKELVTTALENKWDYSRWLVEMLNGEVDRRKESRIKERLKTAGFPQLMYLDDLNRKELPQGILPLLPELETLDFIRSGHNIVLYGNPGTGKTHIATGLGIKACKEGMSVMFTSIPHLITQIKECKSEKTLHLLETRFKRYDLVICDEFGYISCDKEAGELLFNHLSLRAGTKSTIVTTNLAFDRWGEVIRDKVLVAALIDRLTHKAYLINMNGTSYRLKETKIFNQKIN